MPRYDDGNEPHFIPQKAEQVDEVIVGGEPDDPSVYSPYNFDEICSDGWSPRVIGKIVMGVLISHFMDAANIRDTWLQEFVWTSDPNTSKIRIAMNTHWDSRQAGQVPSLNVKQGPFKSQQISLGDRNYYSRADQQQNYARHGEGAYSVVVSGKSDGFVIRLATEVFHLFNAQFSFIRETYPLHRLEATGMTGAQPSDRGDHLFIAQVGVGYAYEFGWARCDAAVADRSFNVSVNAQELT